MSFASPSSTSVCALSLAEAESQDFWRSLGPSHAATELHTTASPRLPSPDALRDALRHEGYVNVPDVLDPAAVARALSLVLALRERGVPLAFAFVYDALWGLFASLGPFLEDTLGGGYRALPDIWVWHLAADDEARGWGPHRDRVRPTVDGDGRLASLTVWLPLTDATPLNGCMYALPAHRDPCFARRVWDGPDGALVPAPQDIRALPAPAGSLLAWNQNLLHWGGRSSRLAEGPRVSVSCEFQRADRSPYNTPWLDPATPPDFSLRLGLIGKQLLQYRHMHPLDEATAALAEALRDRHLDARAPDVTG
jgi:hypothetical protein